MRCLFSVGGVTVAAAWMLAAEPVVGAIHADDSMRLVEASPEQERFGGGLNKRPGSSRALGKTRDLSVVAAKSGVSQPVAVAETSILYTEPMVGSVDFHVPDEYIVGSNILCGFEDAQGMRIRRVEYRADTIDGELLHVARRPPYHLPSAALDELAPGRTRIHALIFGGPVRRGLWIGWLAEDTTIIAPCLGDLDGDGTIGALDFAALMGAWGSLDADLNGDGVVNLGDLLILIGRWGPC